MHRAAAGMGKGSLIKGALSGAMIGYGFIARNGHLPAYRARAVTHRDLEIVAIADVSPERRALAAADLPGVRVYPDATSLFDAEEARLDFVDISTPAYHHSESARDALQRGLHVICEKPLACTSREANAMANAARQAQRVLFPCHNYRHAPVVRAIREELNKNSIGRILSLALHTYRPTHARGVTEWQSDWRREAGISGGGIAMDHGPHALYLILEWMNSPPRSVTAKIRNLNPDFPGTEDEFTAILHFDTGSALVHLSWNAGVRKVLYSLQGETGSILVDDDRMELYAGQRSVETVPSQWKDASHHGWYENLFEEFVEAIRADDFMGADTLKSLHSVRIIEAAYESAAQQSREISLNDR
jgi:predicted dehydrogenase